MPYSGQLHWDYRDGRVAAVASAIVYSMWVLEVVLPGGGTAQGALADPESSFGRFLDSTYRMASVLVILAAGLGLTLGARSTGRWLTVSWWSMAVFGAASLATTLFPGPCVVSTDAVCAAETLAEGIPGATAGQALIAVAAILSALVGVVALTVNRRRAGDRAWVIVAVPAALQLVAAAAVLVLAARLYFTSGDGGPVGALGFLERAHLVTVALWLLTTGILPGPWKRNRTARPSKLTR